MADRREGRPERAGDKEGIGELLRYAGGKRWLVALGCALAAVSAVLALVPYLCIWAIARELFSALPELSCSPRALAAAAVAAASAALSVIVYMAGLGCTHRAAFHIATRIRTVCCEHLLRVPLGFYQSVSSGELRRHIDAGADMTEDVIAHKLPDVVSSIVTPVAVMVLSFTFDWRMGLTCLAPALAGFMMLGAGMGEDAARSMDDYQDALDAMNREAVEYVRGMPVVKVFQQTVYSFKAFHRTIVAYGNLAFGFAQASERPQIAFKLVTSSTFVLLVPVAAFAAGSLPAGNWATFAADALFYAVLCGITPGMLTRIMYIGQSSMSARAALRNVNGILSVEPLPVAQVPEELVCASVAFRDVSFSYPGAARPAVRHASFSAAPGQTVALVGPSGSGKSTLASLIPRFWDADEGTVEVGGCDVHMLDPRDLMENVAFVFQGGRLFRGTLLENVRAARPEASRGDVERALADACCADLLSKLPQGLDTPIGEGGAHLSGGERQRVLLARAILKDAAILVLDEATAFADADNEARIQESLRRVMRGRTVVMVAHRLSTVVDADLILVMDEGAIVERGTHSELLEAGGLYRRMWDDYRTSTAWTVAGRSSR